MEANTADPEQGPAIMPIAARTAGLRHALLGSSRPMAFMSRVAAVEPTSTSS